MSSAPRKQAPRLPRPAARYWKGKAPKGVDVNIESDSEEDEQEEAVEDGAEMIGGEDYEGESGDEEEDDLKVGQFVGKQKAMNITLKDVNISKEGKVIVAGREESGRTAIEALPEEVSEASEEESDEDEVKPGEEESSEESSEEEDEPPKPQFRPVFVPKRGRATIAERDLLAQDTEEAVQRRDEELEERKKQSHDLVAESIRRELAEKEKEDDIPEVDDTDGLDQDSDFEAWRLRELARIKRDKEAALEREQEREEVERRRALPEEQRMKEDLEHAKKSRDEKPKGQQKFLQKYWHKGAFHQDSEILKRHDYTEATESTVDVTLLPKVMQVKNFGKRSRTKYTHLLDQDTTTSSGGFGGTAPVKSGGTSLDNGGCFNCGGPHLKKDCPQLPANGVLGTSRPGPGAQEYGKRQWNGPPHRSNPGSWKDRDRDRDYGRNGRRDDPRQDRRRSRSRSGGRSKSRSPRGERRRDPDSYRDRNRERDDLYRERDKKRDRSPRREGYRNERRRSKSLEDDFRDKRRRVD